tara:strand:+ start:603 stop:767 length:165 start_codon:yes stop_codon:yes gene_type:complete
MATRYWRVEQMTTMGWTLYNDDSFKLSKDKAKLVLEGAMADGIKPSYLRAVPDV